MAVPKPMWDSNSIHLVPQSDRAGGSISLPEVPLIVAPAAGEPGRLIAVDSVDQPPPSPKKGALVRLLRKAISKIGHAAAGR